MKTHLIAAILFIFSLTAFSQTVIYVGGTYTGKQIWNVDTVKVVNSVVISGSLVINPPTVVEFQGNYSIEANGIKALGNIGEEILFTIKDTLGFSNFASGSGGWGGITDYGMNSADSSVFRYCRFEYGKRISDPIPYFKGLLKFGDNKSKVMIDHCVFEHNYSKDGAIIKSDRNTELNHCRIIGNYSNGVSLRIGDAKNSTIRNNKGNGIELWNMECIIANDTIIGNTGYGLYIYQSKRASVLNNVISGNTLGVFLFQAKTVEFCGAISDRTVWDADTIKVFCDVDIYNMLVIKPGTRVEFQGNYSLDADSLFTEGTQVDSIVFTINDTTGFSDFNSPVGGWVGMEILGTLKMKYCRMEYVKNLYQATHIGRQKSMLRLGNGPDTISNSCFMYNYSKFAPGLLFSLYETQVQILNNSFLHNFSAPIREGGGSIIGNTFAYNKGPAIGLSNETGAPRVIANTIHDNEGWGIEIHGYSLCCAYVNNNEVYNNRGGISVGGLDHYVEMKNNIILNNKGLGGVSVGGNAPFKMENNLICYNTSTNGKGGGIFSDETSGGYIKNSTICYNTADYGGGIYAGNMHDEDHGPIIYLINSIITDNVSATGKQIIGFYRNLYSDTIKAAVNLINCNAEGIAASDIIGDYTYSFDEDPQFVNAVGSDFQLKANSPCINTGISDTTSLQLPATDLDGNPRISGNRIDMGAYEFQGKPECPTVMIVHGTYNGPVTWCADTVKVTGDVGINGQLTIWPGTYVEFQGHYGLSVSTIIANGTKSDSIVFTINDTTGIHDFPTENGGWGGISCPVGVFNYCVIEYGKIMAKYIGVIYSYGANVELSNSRIQNNYCNGDRNAVFLTSGMNLKVINCNMSFNHASLTYSPSQASILFENCFISYNNGTVLHNDRGSSTMKNCQILHNGLGIYTFEAGGETITGNIFDSNQGVISIGGSHGCQKGLIMNNIIKNNSSWGIGISQHDFLIQNNQIYNNYGGIACNENDSKIKNNIISNNNGGGGIRITSVCMCHWGDVELINNTICNNSAEYGSGIYSDGVGAFKVINCIMTGNTSLHGKQFYSEKAIFNCSIMNSDVEGIKSDEINGVFTGNIDADPLFIDKDNGNYMLTINSPCINTGTLDTVGLYLPTTDLGGNPRIYGGMIDMGTYEFQKNNFQILQQPVGITVCDRTTAHIETNVVGNVTGYNWQKNGIDLPLENQPVLTFSPISTSDSGYYNCLIFSFGKTLSTDTVKVSVILTASPSVANAEICEGDAVPSLVANGINIKWYNDAQLQNLVQTGSAYKPSVAQIGIYTYYVTQTSQSCESEPTTATLNIKSKPIPTLASSYSACKNINITLSAGTGFASYKWNTGATTESIYVTESGTYAVTITSTNGCSVSKSTEVTIYELPEIELGGPYYAVSGDSIILSAPDEMVSYIWNTGAVTPSITVKESGTYSVAIIDNNSCNNTDAAVVTISDIPVVDIGGPYEACEGKIIELDAGNGFSGYLWSTDETTQKIEVLETGVYTVTVTNSLGFSATDETQVTFLSMPDLQLPEDTAMLVTDTLTLDAGSGYQHYLWSTGSEDQIIKIYDLPVGTYLFSLQVIDKNGCNGYDTIRVLVIAGTYLMDPGSDLNFEIYPVPGKDIIYLKPGSNYDKDIVIRIMDITGRIMLETKIEKLFRSAAYPIDISSLSDGSYYLSISNKKIIKIERITKISGQ